MKVKYSNQTAYANIEDGTGLDGVKYTDLSGFFPDLAPNDAILVKKVYFNLAGDSKNFEAPI